MTDEKTSGLIIAAGEGQRFPSVSDSKPLVEVAGVALIQRVMENAMAAGIEQFHVVTGYRHMELREALVGIGRELEATIAVIFNPIWRRGNGTSVLAAKDHITGDFVLMMADHLVDPRLIKRVLAEGVPDKHVCLAVDHDLMNGTVDLEDVTKVKTGEGYIIRIGKELEEYDAFDTGVFYCSQEIFSYLESSIQADKCDLSRCIQRMADDRLAKPVAVDGYFWVDVDTPAMATLAEDYVCGNPR